jgi:RNA polymerase sigma-70 factor (ECF subfamily)
VESGGEGFASLDCHVIVSPLAEVFELTDRRPDEVDLTTERGRAFRRFADSHLDAAYRLARAILRDPGEAQDATHDAFLQAWRKWSTLRDKSLFEHWFDRILINSCRNRLRRATRWQATDISAEVAMAAGDPFGQAHDRDVLGAALATLSVDHRMVVALRYYRDLSIEEIGSRLGVPSGTVQSRLHYALQRLHTAIDLAAEKGAI